MLHTIAWERNRGYSVELATSGPSGLDELGFPVHRVPELCRELDPRRDISALRQLRRLVDRGGFDVVHTHQSKAGLLGRVAAKGRTRHLLHTVHMASFGAGYNPIASAGFWSAERYAARLTDVTIFVGNELRERYIDAGLTTMERSVVIRSPIDVAGLAETRSWSMSQRLDARRRLGLPTDRQLLLWIGALTKRKRPALAVRALRPILAAGDSVLAIAGSGPEGPALSDAGVHLVNGVYLLGEVSDVRPLIAASDVVVHTSSVEGVPQVVIQALAAGRPTVATDVVGIREIRPTPVSIVPRSGVGLMTAVAQQLERPGQPVPLDALAPWTASVVDSQLQSLHERLT